jgi:hypothetical protein
MRAERKLDLTHDLIAFVQKQVCINVLLYLNSQAEIEMNYAGELEKLYDKFVRVNKRRVFTRLVSLKIDYHQLDSSKPGDDQSHSEEPMTT